MQSYREEILCRCREGGRKLRSLKTYVPSLILAIFLVFSLMGTSAVLVIKNYADSQKLTKLAEGNEITPKIQTELEKYFSSKYNETGIPEEVYTKAITDEYIDKIVELNINAGFNKLDGKEFDNLTGRNNQELENNIEDFFNSYADSIGYTKDDKYREKIDATIDSAYAVITDYCDIYKFGMLNEEGILGKASGIYGYLDGAFWLLAGISCLLAVLIFFINIKSVSAALYWFGISAVISGIIGALPCVYLSFTNFFDSFVIKQQQIFTSFTSLFYNLSDSFMINQIILFAVGILMIIIYAVVPKKSNLS